MRLARAAGTIHKWLALPMGVQIRFWFLSGLFFAPAPNERVRSEHRVASLDAPRGRLCHTGPKHRPR